MREENRYSLERLSTFCHAGGAMTVFLGALVVLMDLLNNDFRHVQVGLFICITGYALVKISSRLETILLKERDL